MFRYNSSIVRLCTCIRSLSSFAYRFIIYSISLLCVCPFSPIQSDRSPLLYRPKTSSRVLKDCVERSKSFLETQRITYIQIIHILWYLMDILKMFPTLEKYSQSTELLNSLVSLEVFLGLLLLLLFMLYLLY